MADILELIGLPYPKDALWRDTVYVEENFMKGTYRGSFEVHLFYKSRTDVVISLGLILPNSLSSSSCVPEVAVPIAVVAAPEDGVDKHTEILKSRSKKVEIVTPLHFVEHYW